MKWIVLTDYSLMTAKLSDLSWYQHWLSTNIHCTAYYTHTNAHFCIRPENSFSCFICKIDMQFPSFSCPLSIFRVCMCLGGLWKWKMSAFSQHALVSVCFHRNASSYQKYVPKCTKGMNVGSHRNNAIANSNKTRLLVWLTY